MNPLNLVTSVFNKIGKTAEWVFPSKVHKHRNKAIPGYSEIVKNKRRDYHLAAQKYFEAKGGNRVDSNDPEYQNVLDKKLIMDEAYKEARENKREFVAKQLCDDYTKGGSKRCWKPVREMMKEGNLKPSSIVEGLKDKQKITDFWQKHYMGKMKGSYEPQFEHSEKFSEVAEPAKKAPEIIFTSAQVQAALSLLDIDKAYYDQYTPKLLKIVKDQFTEFFAEMMTRFVNSSADEQVAFFQEEHFCLTYITPIKKAASLNPTAKKTYRPISVSHTLQMLFERLI